MTAVDAALIPVVGLEIHAQLLTRSKMFCSCSADYSGALPNTHCCPICTGMPGSLPVINARALELGVLTALALNCEVPEWSKFDRKNYSYPDLPKGYQISQYDDPIGRNGHIDFRSGDQLMRWGISRVHLEEDTGKTLHIDEHGREASLVDYNRSGVPLMEIVTTPEEVSPAEARDFFESLRQVLMYLGVSDGNLQEGSLRADVNVSLRPRDGSLGTKVEVKNLNSFRALERALEYEISRQGDLLRAGATIEQETRGWSERDERTLSQRSKEYAHDYRYFPEPDLPPLHIRRELLSRLSDQLPELPAARLARFEQEYGVAPEVARVLTQERALASYFEEAVQRGSDLAPPTLANWLRNDVLRILGEKGQTIEDIPVRPGDLAGLVGLVQGGTISASAGKQVLEEMFRTGEDAESIVARLDLAQVADQNALEALVDHVLTSQPGLVETYRRGKTNVLQAIVGQVMKASKGKANPAVVRGIVQSRLDTG